MEQKTRAQDTKDTQDTQETKDTKDAKDTKDTQDTKDIKDTEDHTKDHTKIVSREESTDLGVQNSWCSELWVHTTSPPTCSKNNKGAMAWNAHAVAVLQHGSGTWLCTKRAAHRKCCTPRSVLSCLRIILAWCQSSES